MNKAVKRIIIGCNLALAIVGLIGAILAVISQRGADFIVGCAGIV